MTMTDTATVTSKSMVNIPAKIREKYGLRPGSKVAFVDFEGGVVMVPLLPLSKLFGIDSAHREEILREVRALEAERRAEARKE